MKNMDYVIFEKNKISTFTLKMVTTNNSMMYTYRVSQKINGIKIISIKLNVTK